MRPEFRETAGVLGGLVGGLLLAVLFLFSIMGGSGFILALLVLALLPVGLAFVAFVNPKPAEVTVAAAVPAAAAAVPAASSAGRAAWKPIAMGTIGTVAMFAAYFGTMSFLEGTGHTIGHLRIDWPGIIGVVGLFGVLVGTATYAAGAHRMNGLALAIGIAGSGLGMVGLLACCTPLIIHVVPWPAVLQVTALIIQYGAAIIIVGMVINAAGSFAILRARTEMASTG